MIAFPQTGIRPSAAIPSHRTVPFDYAFRFEKDEALTGQPGNVISKSVTVSVEGAFTAVSVGYGVVPSRERPPIEIGVQRAAPQSLPPAPVVKNSIFRGIELGEVINGIAQAIREFATDIGPRTAEVLKIGLRLNPEIAELALQNDGKMNLDASILSKLFQVVAEGDQPVQFLYTLIDEGSGREFQSDSILNIAGLGIPNGDRPFRYFAKPIVFDAMTTITMRITELSRFVGELHVSLQGYKTLGGANTPTSAMRQRARRR